MPKKPVSLTLDATNLLWLKGRARATAGGSVSEAVDRIVAQARTGRLGAAGPARSVVGTIDLPDPDLADADAAIRRLIAASLARPARKPAVPRPSRRRTAAAKGAVGRG
jgi:hypothetical protein